MNLKKLKFLIGGLTLAVFTVVVIFAASPSHAQADGVTEGATEIVANDAEMSNELCTDTKDCSTECMKNKECKTVCAPGCDVPCE
ncbi:MAG: hypothetical protein GQ574_11140 [Crocinitomix sp.]|nr:hypothetical protein [Crocinitomix sp.]